MAGLPTEKQKQYKREKSTLATRIYGKLREDIISGVVPPGSKIKIHSVSEQFGVGLSPAREALNRLMSDRLVIQSERRGFSVAQVSEAELADLTKTRCLLNEIALRESIRLGDRAWEDELLAAYFALSRTPRDDNQVSGNWNAAHQRFHEALLAACGSKFLIGYCRDLFFAAERYRFLGTMVAESHRSDTDKEHRAIMQAAIDRNASEAVSLLVAHYEKTQTHLRVVLEERGAATGPS